MAVTAVMNNAVAMKMIVKRTAVVCAKLRRMTGTRSTAMVKMAARVLAIALMSGFGIRTTSDATSSLPWSL